MRKTNWKYILIVILAAGIAGIVIYNYTEIERVSLPEISPTGTTSSKSLIRVDSPESGQTVESPLVVRGEARGNWYFEATFPIRLENEDGDELALVAAQAQDDWMTEDFVPFRAELEFEQPQTNSGTLILEKANPSDLPENADKIEIPVQF